jgi:hypothetical protein
MVNQTGTLTDKLFISSGDTLTDTIKREATMQNDAKILLDTINELRTEIKYLKERLEEANA